MKSNNNALLWLKDLVAFKSVTPDSAGSIEYIASRLTKLGFDCDIQTFDDTVNLYSKYGSGKNLCFLGHVDVVPTGNLADWKSDPFVLTQKDNNLYGRGVADMKGGIAAFLSATEEFISNLQKPKNFAISVLLTSDEEGSGKNGSVKMLEYLHQKGEKIDFCVVGEPTATKLSGDTIKIGRRGSINFTLTIRGKQGHVAYPQLAHNPIPYAGKIVNALSVLVIDGRTADFDASNLEITNIEVNNKATNVIPNTVKIFFNIRYNNTYTADQIITKIGQVCEKNLTGIDYILEQRVSGKSFVTKGRKLANLLSTIIKDSFNIDADLSTSGGTSDARFMIDYCDDLVELGLSNATIHQIDESIEIKDFERLQQIYYSLLERFEEV